MEQKTKERIGLLAICSGIALLLIVFPILQYVYAAHDGVPLRLPAPQRWDPDLKAEHFRGTPPFDCGEETLPRGQNSTHLARYTDAANNTVDIYCQWMDFTGNDGLGIVQFIAFYNNNTIIGQCPYEKATNHYNIKADENNIINQTIWISTTPNMEQSVMWNMTFNSYNQTEMAHRPGENYETIASGLYWDVYG